MMGKKRGLRESTIMKLRVGPKKYRVLAAQCIEHDGQSCVGQCDSQSGTILIDVTYFPSSQRETLFHEAIHAVDHLMRINLTEEQVQALGVGLLNLIDDNPHLLAFHGVKGYVQSGL